MRGRGGGAQVTWLDPIAPARLFERLTELAGIIALSVLALTDPVLAADVGLGPPGRDRRPEANVSLAGEAGLNDGLAFPLRPQTARLCEAHAELNAPVAAQDLGDGYGMGC